MTKCPVCQSDSYFLAGKKDKFSQEYIYLKCVRCDFLFENDMCENPKRLQKKISKAYEENYDTIDFGWKDRGDKVSLTINKLLKLYRYLSFKKTISILDYGSGNGYIASKISRDFNVFCYDKYEKPIYQGNYQITEKPIKTEIVCAVELAEHLVDLEEWSEILRFGPRLLFFTTELSDGIKDEKMADWWYLKPEVGHTCIYSLESLFLLAKKYGYFYFFFPSKSFHIFFRCKFFKNINFAKVEYLIYKVLRKCLKG